MSLPEPGNPRQEKGDGERGSGCTPKRVCGAQKGQKKATGWLIGMEQLPCWNLM